MTTQVPLNRQKNKHFIFIKLALKAEIHIMNSQRDFAMIGINLVLKYELLLFR